MIGRDQPNRTGNVHGGGRVYRARLGLAALFAGAARYASEFLVACGPCQVVTSLSVRLVFSGGSIGSV
eukprot:766638-Hanusia_phi.AAC.7